MQLVEDVQDTPASAASSECAGTGVGRIAQPDAGAGEAVEGQTAPTAKPMKTSVRPVFRRDPATRPLRRPPAPRDPKDDIPVPRSITPSPSRPPDVRKPIAQRPR